MATLDSLPGDQRAVLQLVLGRGRSYDEIAGLLKIGRDAVRDRALAALDALGPQTRLASADRQMICDYLLGQLPEAEVSDVRERLAQSAPERAWARVLSAELVPVASGPLPEIPSEAGPSQAGAAEPGPQSLMAMPVAEEEEEEEEAGPAPHAGADQDEQPRRRREQEQPAPPTAAETAGDGSAPRSSRRGGFVVIALVVIIIAVVVVVIVKPGSSKQPASSAASPATTTPPAATPSTPAAATGTAPAPGTGTSTTAAPTSTAASAGTAQPSVQINLTPTHAGSKAEGIADVLKEGSQKELAIVAQGLPPNTAKNAYEVWLYNSPSDAQHIGFGPVVGANGKLAAAGPLPANAAHYKQLIVTLETTKAPKTPGPIVMQGQVTGLS